MVPAPWDSVPARDTSFVLVTGANSGIGLGICQRLIDEFLATRSLTSHLIVIPTTRSARKSAETIALLRRHLYKTASSSSSSSKLRARGAAPEGILARVHITSVQLDLCDFATVRRAAGQLLGGTLALEGHGEVRIPRLDAVVLNAGIGGWTGLDWPRAAHNVFTAGWVQATTWPTFKAADPGLVTNPLPGSSADGDSDSSSSMMGTVFCANVFGHYLLAHAILPLLSRRRRGEDDDVPPGRIIWESSLEATGEHFSRDDFQAVRSRAAYESTKRLTDLLCLTADLPSVRPHALSYWEGPEAGRRKEEEEEEEEDGAVVGVAGEEAAVRKPKVYLCHPGIVVTTIFPLPLVLFYAYKFAMYITRWLGSPWHTNTSYNAAASMVWLALAAQGTLDDEGAGKVKWGSACDFWGNSMVKKTEVDGWGWQGKVEDLDDEDDDRATRVLRKITGRKRGAEVVTEETRAEFEEMGASCWREMERLRGEWEARIEKTVASNGHA
ncbi:3-keto-steroid reductase [Cytospora paraplurivora]|uniref:3-keto-steroid reductase n=1 Tax=Cytospora paraplurivora TaxID=2898453 RepID=A0AAN9YIN4_9PEZI